jgi:hypothetical protein
VILNYRSRRPHQLLFGFGSSQDHELWTPRLKKLTLIVPQGQIFEC